MTKLTLELPFDPVTKIVDPSLLLHAKIPRPLHGLSPRIIIGKEWWDKERQKVYEKNGYHCMACGVHKDEAKYHQWLEAHETYRYDYERGIAEFIGIVALCHSCHNFIHRGRLGLLCKNGKITRKKFDDIIQHGLKILGGRCIQPFPSRIADWKDWKLVVNGKAYPARYTCSEDWQKAYKNAT